MRYAPTLVRLKLLPERLILDIIPAVEGVCDTPLHLFDYNYCLNDRFWTLFPAVECVCDTPIHLFDYNYCLND